MYRACASECCHEKISYLSLPLLSLSLSLPPRFCLSHPGLCLRSLSLCPCSPPILHVIRTRWAK